MEDQAPRDALAAHLIPCLPPSCYYIPTFLTLDEESLVLCHLYALPPTRWTQLSRRRLLSFPSPLTGSGRDTLLSAPLPSFLSSPFIPRFSTLGLFQQSPHRSPNHCLVNEYRPGEGIMPHEDGPAYYPCTATVSLGSHSVLDVYEKNAAGEREREPRWRILQERGSLLVTLGGMYSVTLHGISEREIDERLDEDNIVNWSLLGDKSAFTEGRRGRESRISLTFRDVKKVVNFGGAVKFLQKK